MGKDYEKGLYSPELMEEIRSRFEYVDWDPYSGKRIYLEAASGSLRPKSGFIFLASSTIVLTSNTSPVTLEVCMTARKQVSLSIFS